MIVYFVMKTNYNVTIFIEIYNIFPMYTSAIFSTMKKHPWLIAINVSQICLLLGVAKDTWFLGQEVK